MIYTTALYAPLTGMYTWSYSYESFLLWTKAQKYDILLYPNQSQHHLAVVLDLKGSEEFPEATTESPRWVATWRWIFQ